MPIGQTNTKSPPLKASSHEFYHKALAAYFSAYRAKTSLTQEQVATRFGISAASYRRLETYSELSPAGVNFGVILSIAEVEKVRPSEALRLLEDLQGTEEPTQGRSPKDEAAVTKYFAYLSELEEKAKSAGSSAALPDRIRWAMKLATYLIALSEKALLTFEIQVLDQFLESHPSGREADEARRRLRKIVTSRYAT